MKVMLAGPFSGSWEPVKVALEQIARDGSFFPVAWDTETHLGSVGDIQQWRETTRNVDAIIFLFGITKKGSQPIVNSGTVIQAGKTVRGQTSTYNTTATEQEYLHCFLRPVPHLFLLPAKPKTFDQILTRMMRWASEALGTVPTKYADSVDASTKSGLFVAEVVKRISERSRFTVQQVSELGKPDAHDLGIKEPSVALLGAPHHVKTALEELAVSFAARRQDSSDLLETANAAVGRALSLCLIPPRSTLETSADFFNRLGIWAKTGPKYESLPGAPNFAECFFRSLSAWERTVLLIAACEAGLIYRYHRKHAEELRIHEIVASGAAEILSIPPGTTPEATKIFTWAIARWKEVFAAAAVYAGHPRLIQSILKRLDWDNDLAATFKLIDKWGVLSELPGNWELRLKQLQGVVHAAEEDSPWPTANKYLSQAVNLSRNTSGRQLVHSLLFKLWTTKEANEREILRKEIDALCQDPDPKRRPDSLRRWLYAEHKNSLWQNVFPRLDRLEL